MDVVLRRGTLDGSKVTWGEIQVIASENARLCNPVPIIDHQTNTILLFYKHFADATIHLTKSTDIGETWSSHVNVTQQISEDTDNNIGAFIPGTGNGIQLKSGRLVLPGYTVERDQSGSITSFTAGVLLSDDHGNKWYLGGEVPGTTAGGTKVSTNETAAALLEDDSICLNSRTSLGKSQPRAQSFSQDGGKTFGPPQLVSNLIEPKNLCGAPAGCSASVLGFQPPDQSPETWALFSNPAKKVIRCRMSIRLSRDGCKTWSNPWKIRCCASGYPSLTQYPAMEVSNPNFAIAYESIAFTRVKNITFQTFDLNSVIQGTSGCNCCCCCCCCC
ncbi:sialidase-4-like [Amphiura filiformis]|uniref:sialidase-4-like n=1 Tax=Amphiura filiformis TaxID=82378 RepID=UPI003B227A63